MQKLHYPCAEMFCEPVTLLNPSIEATVIAKPNDPFPRPTYTTKIHLSVIAKPNVPFA